MNYQSVRIFTYSSLNVVSQVLLWWPRMSSNFDWITTRHIPSIDVFYYWIPNDNDVLQYFRLIVRFCTNDVAIYLRCNTNIILYYGKIGRIWWPCNQRLIIIINNAFCLHFFQVCLNWLFIAVRCTCSVKISDNFIYCQFLFAYVSNVLITSNIWVSIM